jgi:hypothetical protein
MELLFIIGLSISLWIGWKALKLSVSLEKKMERLPKYDHVPAQTALKNYVVEVITAGHNCLSEWKHVTAQGYEGGSNKVTFFNYLDDGTRNIVGEVYGQIIAVSINGVVPSPISTEDPREYFGVRIPYHERILEEERRHDATRPNPTSPAAH